MLFCVICIVALLQTGKCVFSDAERQLISLPSRLGGLGIINPCVTSTIQFDASRRVTGPLVSLILEQDSRFTIGALNEQLTLKHEIHLENHHRTEGLAASLHPLLPTKLQSAQELACLKGASSWLTVLRTYLWMNMAFHCIKVIFVMLCVFVMAGCCPTFQQIVFVVPYLVNHAFTCYHGGYLTLRHNEIRDITARLMSEVCPNVATEPTLQPVTNKRFFHRSANTESGARLDVRAQGFWGLHHQQAHFDVRVFNPLATSNRRTSISTCFRSHDRKKCRVYEQRVREVEKGFFTPLVFSALGGASRATKLTYKRLTSLLATKKD